MIETFRKIAEMLDARERRNALLLLGMMVIMGVFEAAGVASIMPFIAVLGDPSVIHDNVYLKAIFDGLSFSDTDSFLLLFGGVVFILVIGSLTFKAFTLWAMARYVNMRGYSLSCRLLRGYLRRSYSYFLNQHSADLGKSVLSEVQLVVNDALMPAVQLVAYTIVAVFLFGVVITAGPEFAMVAISVLGGAYILIYMLVRKHLGQIGSTRLHANTQRFQIAQEALGGIKDVKVLGLEEGYLRSFKRPALRYAQALASNQIVGQLPQFALQGLAFGGLIIVLLTLLVVRGGNIGTVLPLIALYAFAGIRLLPALQQVYQALTKLRYGRPALDALYADLKQSDDGDADSRAADEAGCLPAIRLLDALRFEDISYAYPHSERPALSNLSLTINACTTIGLVGPTGAGKTTVVDLILGLLVPQEGSLLVDGQSVERENVRAWQRNVGYVPQNIFLTDDTVAANIAFGVSPESIDAEAVERAARIAEIHQFVTQDMPLGYDTLVGERGVRLSGGQRQRIGIARALYHDPDVLVFDEATSALDNLTEKAVMDAVHNMGRRKTIILIAHRLSTVRACDEIFVLEGGRLKASGTYEALLSSDSQFQAMAAV